MSGRNCERVTILDRSNDGLIRNQQVAGSNPAGGSLISRSYSRGFRTKVTWGSWWGSNFDYSRDPRPSLTAAPFAQPVVGEEMLGGRPRPPFFGAPHRMTPLVCREPYRGSRRGSPSSLIQLRALILR